MGWISTLVLLIISLAPNTCHGILHTQDTAAAVEAGVYGLVVAPHHTARPSPRMAAGHLPACIPYLRNIPEVVALLA